MKLIFLNVILLFVATSQATFIKELRKANDLRIASEILRKLCKDIIFVRDKINEKKQRKISNNFEHTLPSFPSTSKSIEIKENDSPVEISAEASTSETTYNDNYLKRKNKSKKPYVLSSGKSKNIMKKDKGKVLENRENIYKSFDYKRTPLKFIEYVSSILLGIAHTLRKHSYRISKYLRILKKAPTIDQLYEVGKVFENYVAIETDPFNDSTMWLSHWIEKYMLGNPEHLLSLRSMEFNTRSSFLNTRCFQLSLYEVQLSRTSYEEEMKFICEQWLPEQLGIEIGKAEVDFYGVLYQKNFQYTNEPDTVMSLDDFLPREKCSIELADKNVMTVYISKVWSARLHSNNNDNYFVFIAKNGALHPVDYLERTIDTMDEVSELNDQEPVPEINIKSALIMITCVGIIVILLLFYYLNI